MSSIEIIILVLASICCTGGIGWLLYDMEKQLKAYKQACEESTLGLIKDEEDDEEK